jgi:predicted nucleic acid-binding Zn ribbon protein
VKHKNEQTLSEAIREWLDYNRLEEKFMETKLNEEWATHFGPTIARLTNKISIKSSTLYLLIDSAPLKQELYLQSEQLIKKVNEVLGKDVITKVVIQ